MDNRPICNCNAYKFPHRVGGKCKAHDFVLFNFQNKTHCEFCNCLNDNSCDVLDGVESIKEAECYSGVSDKYLIDCFICN